MVLLLSFAAVMVGRIPRGGDVSSGAVFWLFWLETSAKIEI